MAQDYRWSRFGEHGADGIPGGTALALGLDAMVTGITSPPDTPRGIAARLRYLTASSAGYTAMGQAGISVTRRTLYAWLAEERSPSPANRSKLDAAYWALRRRRVVAELKRRLSRGGGTRVEIDPVDQREVPGKYRRDLQIRRITLRPHIWDAAVDAWVADDIEDLGAIWDEAITGLGSDYDSYTHVASVGWNA
ncbi:transcriptional regulator [Streptomyces sp. P38-E01]|uniref:Transcriptional regulator n=1 Tax=Streptomyces tardus TaxID=2780544 RepID=A0A949JK39_9ACTN|nr:transcriptional regulator [Streptomyces tardus]MBU7600927.1 transcriptional regulator [Streptomyces tardus]